VALGILFPGPASVRRQVTAGAAGGVAALPTPDAFYRLEEAHGTPRADSTAGGLTLTENGTVNSGAGKLGNGAVLTGSNSIYLGHASAAALRGNGTSGPFTIGCWGFLQPLSFVPNILVSVWGSGSSIRGYQIGTSANSAVMGNPLFNVEAQDQSAAQQITGTSPLSANTWYCFLAWWDNVGNTLNLQVNGASVATPISWTKGVRDATSQQFRIGGDDSANAGQGTVDCVAIWHTVLTSGQQAAWYNGGAGAEFSGGVWH